jgi:hypothetical protein
LVQEALVGISDEAWAVAAEKRCKGLVHLLGIGDLEASDTSIKGRLSVIARLKAAKRSEITWTCPGFVERLGVGSV